jgi:hypothetical protein
MNTPDPSPSTRRNFLHQAAGIAAGLAAVSPGGAADTKNALLPTIKLGPHAVTRLILGGNPIYGHSHFNRLFSQHMTTWHTPEHVLALVQRAEQAGINTWQNSYAERTLQDLDRYREAGGKMNWLCLGKGDWEQRLEFIDEAAKRKPIGIAPHGHTAEKLHREKQINVLSDMLKRIRQTGALVGLSAHNPALIELSEEKGWDVDYYMCCLYYLSRPRAEYEKLLGNDLPLGEIYLQSDPPRMFKVVQTTRKPCLVYKVLAAGRRVESKSQIRTCFDVALKNIKATDAMIVGMYQQFGDQVGENVAMVRELCRK